MTLNFVNLQNKKLLIELGILILLSTRLNLNFASKRKLFNTACDNLPCLGPQKSKFAMKQKENNKPVLIFELCNWIDCDDGFDTNR